MFDGNRLTKAMTARFAIPDLKFVVIVPGGVDAFFQQLTGHVLLPPGDGIRVGEIQMRAFVVPETGAFRVIRLESRTNSPLAATS